VSADDLALWGATDDDAATLPPPDTRRIGERLFIRPRGMEAGKAARLPLRLSPDFLARAIEAGDGVAQCALVVAELGDDTAREVWAGFDQIDQTAVAARYFEAVQELLGMAAGK
jgi:hypothetical protein